MAVSVRFKCDICGVEKKETNKWFQADVLRDVIKIEPLDYSRLDNERVIICGENCVHKYISANLPALHS